MLNGKYSIIFKTLLVVGVASSFNAFSQLKIVQIDRQSPSKENKAARTESLPARALPFWDDFSSTKTPFPDTTTWEKNSAVWVNSGTGIDPPSLNVATFDGYDALGKPYSVNNVLANGLADQLTSGPLKLGDVPPAERTGVYISFFYQFAGNGDAPEPGDVFSLLFKNASGQWRQAWSIESSTLSKPDEFIQILVPIVGGEYFHNEFQFRFQNFGRLSGPFDTWNLDYVYISNGKTQYPEIYQDFPDRTVTTPLTSFLKGYRSMPVKHFFSNSTGNTVFPTVGLTNRRADQALGGQPIDYDILATITSKSNGTVSNILANKRNVNQGLLYKEKRTLIVDTLPNLSSFASETEFLKVKLDFTLGSRDNEKKRKVIIPGNPIPSNIGDYDTIVYKGVNFNANDRTFSETVLSDYYAYDDGVAEYGANTTGAGTQLAYQFDMSTNKQDTIVGIDLFFPKFGDETNQNIQLHILGALTGNQSDYLFQKIIPVVRSNRNDKTIFKRDSIPGGVVVKNTFYIGWKLTSAAEIPIGLDANNDSGEKIFVNSAGSWIQNKTLKGSLMIRPVFGKPKDLTTSATESVSAKPFPNPTQQRFFLPNEAKEIQLYTVTGSSVSFEQTDGFDHKEITISHPVPGLYLVRYFNQVWHTEKIMVAP